MPCYVTGAIQTIRCLYAGDYTIYVAQASSYISMGLYHRCHFLWGVVDCVRLPFFLTGDGIAPVFQ